MMAESTTNPCAGGARQGASLCLPRPVLGCIFDVAVLVPRRIGGELHAYPGSTRFLRTVRSAGIHTAIVSREGGVRSVIQASGLRSLAEVVLDAADLAVGGSVVVPLFDVLMAASWQLGLTPSDIAVFSDGHGVHAGRSAHFGVVVGVDRAGRQDGRLFADADLTVTDLDVLVER